MSLGHRTQCILGLMALVARFLNFYTKSIEGILEREPEMKKLLLMLTLTVFAPCAFAQPAVNVSAIDRTAKKAQSARADEIKTLETRLDAALEQFRREVFTQQYYRQHFVFQSMDGVREAYMALRAASVPAAQRQASAVNAETEIDNGKGLIRIVDFINMEGCMLPVSERVKFEPFGEQLAEDAASDAAQRAQAKEIFFLQDTLYKAVDVFAARAFQSNYYDYSYMFQSLDLVREAYLDLRKVSIAAAREAAPTVNRQISLAQGKIKIHIADYVRMESINLYTTEQVKFDAFGEMLERDLKK